MQQIRDLAFPAVPAGRPITSRARAIACEWLAALGPLSWSFSSQGSGYRACNAFYGGRELRRATHQLVGNFLADEGLATLFGGGLRTYQEQGAVMLVTGPAGSGKTSMAASMAASALLEDGYVLFLSTEETREAIRMKMDMVTPALTKASRERLEGARKLILVGIDDLARAHGRGAHTGIGDALRGALDQEEATVDRWMKDRADASRSGAASAALPVCLVIDSLTPYALLQAHEDAPEKKSTLVGRIRRELVAIITMWRKRGAITVMAVGSQPTEVAEQAEYLADYVIRLSATGGARSLCLAKSRLQASVPDEHYLHISDSGGLRVFPSLAAELRAAKERSHAPAKGRVLPLAWIHRAAALPAAQLPLRFRSKDADAPSGLLVTAAIREGEHATVGGVGSVGKAEYCLRALLCESVKATGPLVRLQLPASNLEFDAMWARGEEGGLPQLAPLRRVLVVSFFHSQDAFRVKARRVVARLLGKQDKGSRLADEMVRIVDFYPGEVDVGVFLRKVEEMLDEGALDGRPFDGVLIDSIHNAILAFPRLGKEILVWPVLIDMCRERGCSTFSTFTRMFPVAEKQPEQDPTAALISVVNQMLVSRAETTLDLSDRLRKVELEVRFSVRLPRPNVCFLWDRRKLDFTGARAIAADTEEEVPHLQPGAGKEGVLDD